MYLFVLYLIRNPENCFTFIKIPRVDMYKYVLTSFFIVSSLMLFVSCESETANTSSSTFTIGVNEDPEKLNPVFNPKVNAREIYNTIFLPLADFHPVTFELVPILIDAIAQPTIISQDTIAFDISIKDDATWADGKPITASDYVFAIKAVKHTGTQASAWRPYLSIVYDIIIDKDNPKLFRVICDRSAMLAQETVLTFYPLPEHNYDPELILRAYDLAVFNDEAEFAKQLESDSVLNQFATNFNNPQNYRDNLTHAGPYKLEQWESDQYLVLSKVVDYWGAAYPDNPYLFAGHDTIVFKIIKDDVALFTLLKDGGVDMTKSLSVDQFNALKDDPSQAKKFSYATPETMRVAYLAMNNRDEKLSSKAVRKALAHSLDITALIEAEQNGYAQPIAVLLPTRKRGYPNHLNPRTKDTALAQALLKADGWSDSNNDGTVDKIIGLNSEELIVDLFISGSKLSKTIALLLKEGANEAGMDINIIQKDTRAYIKENVYTHDFDMAALSASFDAADEDPYPRWHSDNMIVAGRNRVGFDNARADSLITIIRNTYDFDERAKFYKEFQEIFYEECPVIPLFVPQDVYIIKAGYDGVVTPKRPGYFANTFRKI